MNKSRLIMIIGVLLLSLTMVGVSLADNHISDATGSRSGVADKTPPIVYVSPASFSEGFEDITNLPGWYMQNNSNPIGLTNWFQGNDTVFPAHAGPTTSYIGANYNNTAGIGTISNWLLTPEQPLGDGATFTFWTRTATGSSWPDRLQVRLSLAGASTDVGTSAEDVGVFTTLLLDINPTLQVGGYPEVWTQFSVTLSSIPPGSSGRIAFRYYVTNGGPSGDNSNYIGIDTVEYIEPVLVPDIEVSPLSLLAEQPADSITQQNVEICNVGDGILDWQISEQPGMLAGALGLPARPAVSLPKVVTVDESQSEMAEPFEGTITQVGKGLEGSAGSSGFGNPDAVLWDNGPLVTLPGACGGMDASRLQTELGMNTLGFGHQFINGYRMADEFTIAEPGGWHLDQITFFAYQTGGPVSPSPITAVYYQIWDGPPNDPGSSIVFGDLTTNRLLSSTSPNMQRDSGTSPCANNRYIFADVASAGVDLPAGTYWIDWMTDGNLASGPWAPPITILGQTTTGNALQFTTAWAPALDTGTLTQQGMPFVIEGTVTDIPWLDETPKSGSLAAGACTAVNVSFDSTGLTLGIYSGDLLVNSNDPDEPTITVPVTLDVVAPPDISTTPASLESTQPPNATTTDLLQVCNTGGYPLDWNSSEDTAFFGGSMAFIPVTVESIGEAPEGLTVSSTPAQIVAPSQPANPDAVLWDQPLSVVSQSAYVNQAFPDLPDYSSFLADDFVSAESWIIQSIFIPGHGWNGFSTLLDAESLTWQIYADASGKPAGDPSGGGMPPLWTLTLAPGDPRVVITSGSGMLPSNTQLNLSVPLILPPGHYWLVFYPTMRFDCCGQFGRQPADTTNGNIGQFINPGNGFGYGTAWQDWSVIGPTQADIAFRLEGVVAGDIPWLSESPTSGSVMPGTCQDVMVTFDSTGLPLGTYTGDLFIYSNDPDEPVVTIPVTLNVDFYGFFLPLVQR